MKPTLPAHSFVTRKGNGPNFVRSWAATNAVMNRDGTFASHHAVRYRRFIGTEKNPVSMPQTEKRAAAEGNIGLYRSALVQPVGGLALACLDNTTKTFDQIRRVRFRGVHYMPGSNGSTLVVTRYCSPSSTMLSTFVRVNSCTEFEASARSNRLHTHLAG